MQTMLQNFKDNLAKSFFGFTLDEAYSKQVCIACKAPVEQTDWSAADIDEWLISGLCPTCIDNITKKD